MPATYEPIASTTLTSTATSITFSSISSSYTDLRVVLFANTTNAGGEENSFMRFNSDSSTNYSNTWLTGDGGSRASGQVQSATAIWSRWSEYGAGTSVWTMTTFDIFNYTGSKFKTVLATGSADANGSGWVTRTVGIWRSTSAITSITLPVQGAGSFEIGTTAALYGIKAA